MFQFKNTNPIDRSARLLLRLEWLIIAITALAYWYPSPTRDAWVGLIGLMLLVLAARWWLYRRLWTATALDLPILALFWLAILSVFTAPYPTRGIILLYRPLLGAVVVAALGEYARGHRLRVPLGLSAAAALFLGVLSLTAVSWSASAPAITDALPRLEAALWSGGFNPNELAGALTWLLPIAAALAVRRRWWWAGVGPMLMLCGLVLGLSIAGLLGAIVGLLIVLTPGRWWRLTAGLMVGVVLLVQVLIITNPFAAASLAMQFSPIEDTTSLDHRAELWHSAVAMLVDYPVSGVGIAMYRAPVVRMAYPTPNFPDAFAVHPHNELLQFAADVGWPGIVVVLWLYGAALWMLHTAWSRGDELVQAAAVGVAAGLIGHSVYGLADAIAIWDRFALIFWWMLGLSAALCIYAREDQGTLLPDK